MATRPQAGLHTAFFFNLVARQVRQDYLENLTGLAWLVLQPVMMLAVYAFVFTTIFKARLPDAVGVGFVPYLAIAFWPWNAFAEAVLKSSGSITQHAALIGKVAFASEQLPLATVTATFVMNLAGYLVVLIILAATGTEIHWLMLLPALAVLLLLWMLACSLALLASASQVFIRDIAQILPPVMTFWFFTTPILYSPSFLPESLRGVMAWNPMTWFVMELRDLLLFGQFGSAPGWGLALVLIPLLLWLSLRYFRRFSGHFEDFL